MPRHNDLRPGEAADERDSADAATSLRVLTVGTRFRIGASLQQDADHRECRLRRERRDLAECRGGGVLNEVPADAVASHQRGLPDIESGSGGRVSAGTAGLEIDRHEPQPFENRKTECDQALAFPRLLVMTIDFEVVQA